MTDVLKEISNENLPKLAEFYKKHVAWAPHVLSVVHTFIEWKKSPKYCDSVRFWSPDDSWEEDGTVIVLMTFHCYSFFVFTVDEECRNLKHGLALTQLLDWTNPQAFFFCIHEKHLAAITEVMHGKNLKIVEPDHYFMYTLPPHKATFEISCPPEVYLRKLDPDLAQQIDQAWAHRFPGSQQHLSVLIEMNGGYGIFLKSTNEMVAWVVKHCFGHIGVLQTEHEYRMRGYATILTKKLAQEIVQDGNWPVCTIFHTNGASVSLFEKLGFEKIGKCVFTHVKPE